MKVLFGCIVFATVVFGGYLILRQLQPSENQTEVGDASNVRIEDGKQIIEIKAKGGYIPRVSTAQAGIPTILRVNTKGTFDCSSSIRIPSKGVSQLLPASGSTDIALGVLDAGVLRGSCGMGMYPFEVNVTKK